MWYNSLQYYQDSSSEFWGVLCFRGSRYTTSSDMGLTHDVVMQLTSTLTGHNYMCFTDNYYTSPALADSLQQVSIISLIIECYLICLHNCMLFIMFSQFPFARLVAYTSCFRHIGILVNCLYNILLIYLF